MKWKDEYKEALQSIYKLCIKWENQQIIKKRGKDLQKKSDKKKTTKQNKTANSPGQDRHPDWDRFRGPMLYPLSCGELAMIGE